MGVLALSSDAVDVPDRSAATKHARYNASAKGRSRRRTYRHTSSKWQTDAAYLGREFIGWDGEGITLDDGRHVYVMLANSRGHHVMDPHGLSTLDCLEFLCDEARTTGSAVHIIYGGSYDANMWLCDFTEDELREVYSQEYMRWRGFRIAWRAGKSFYVARLDVFGNVIAKVMVYDVVSFFQCTFVKACDDYLGPKFTHREMIVENKALRSSFTADDIERVRTYNDAELENLVTLMLELRSRLNKVGLRPKRWDGPGAVASALLQRESVKDSQAECPDDVARAARFAYAGGRFEVVRFGHVPEIPAYEYDVNSAYPSALREVPDLQRGRWVRTNGDPGLQPYALYHVRAVSRDESIPGPLFRRDVNGTICYPLRVTGWYWTPEVETAREYCAMGYGEMEVSEAWVFEHDASAPKPFAFIEGLYNKRRALKKAGDGAHVGIKLGLNSLYGKLAQQVGWKEKDNGDLRLPPFHQLEWAGFVTAHCRASVLRAALGNLDSVIAFETDAIFTSEPLDLAIGSNLGEFERTIFGGLTYVQSGLYFGVTESGAVINKTRGVDRGSLTRAEVVAALSSRNADERIATASLTRFVGAGVALSQSMDRWRRWETVEKNMTLAPTGKREHSECESCGDYRKGEQPIAFGKWHSTYCPMLNDTHSCEFPIEWINPNPEMNILSELRETVESYDGD